MMNRERLIRQNQQMTLKPVPTFRRSKVTSSIVITMNLEFNSTCPKEETFPISVKYVDVTRSCPYGSGRHTRENDLTIMGMSIRANVCLILVVDSWNSLCWEGGPPKGYMWSRGRLTKISNNYQTRSCTSRSLDEKFGKAAQNRIINEQEKNVT